MPATAEKEIVTPDKSLGRLFADLNIDNFWNSACFPFYLYYMPWRSVDWTVKNAWEFDKGKYPFCLLRTAGGPDDPEEERGPFESPIISLGDTTKYVLTQAKFEGNEFYCLLHMSYPNGEMIEVGWFTVSQLRGIFKIPYQKPEAEKSNTVPWWKKFFKL